MIKEYGIKDMNDVHEEHRGTAQGDGSFVFMAHK
jgi:hypothetical protein